MENNIYNSHFDTIRFVPYIVDNMEWTKPQYGRDVVDAAGKTLIKSNVDMVELVRAVEVINNWRSAHCFPLNTFQIGLRKKAKSVYSHSLIAQRIKRLPAIQEKLKLMDYLNLSKMQDIGGCRAVVGSIRGIRRIVNLYHESWHKHHLIKENDYLSSPRDTGYRSYHLIYGYKSDKKDYYNDLRIEIQIRSKLQHYWATAVETVGASMQQALKSGGGEKEWLRFFALMGTIIARKEKTTPVPKTPTNRRDLIRELRDLIRRLNVVDRLNAYRVVPYFATSSADENIKYRLLILNTSIGQVRISNYSSHDTERAFKEYSEVEKEINGKPDLYAVLASTDDMRHLKRAYPNYFGDTKEFVKIVEKAIK